MAELFQSTKQNISPHPKNVFDGGNRPKNELSRNTGQPPLTARITAQSVTTFEAIVAVGYRVKSHRGTQFRKKMGYREIERAFGQKGFLHGR